MASSDYWRAYHARSYVETYDDTRALTSLLNREAAAMVEDLGEDGFPREPYPDLSHLTRPKLLAARCCLARRER